MKIEYAINRYAMEVKRQLHVLDTHLADNRYMAGDDYTIADMASYPWIVPWERQGQNLDDFPDLKRWFHAVKERPATVRAYEKAQPYTGQPAVTEEGKKILFGQTAKTQEK